MNKKKLKSQIAKLSGILRVPWMLRVYNNLRYLYRKPYTRLLDIIPVAGHGLFVSGWLLDPARKLESVEIQLGSDQFIDVSQDLHWLKDDKLSRRFGLYRFRLSPVFIMWLRLPQLEQQLPSGSRLCFISRGGRVRYLPLTTNYTANSALQDVERVLRAVPRAHTEKRTLFDKVYGPLLQAIWQNRESVSSLPEVVEYNGSLAADKPVATLVIPIYARYDFIEYQLSEFVNDPGMREHEILYVIDDPRIAAEVRHCAEVLSKLYAIAYRIVYLPENLGFAGANNAAARHASGDLLLLINSDVMPAGKGWLNQLIESAGSSVNHSITSTRLLYEDNSIQHDGMRFFASPFVDDLWTNVHPGKGLPADQVDCAGTLQEVEAVTGACMLVSRDNFKRLGGFDENYILGDYEDSDLCLKARQLGMRIQINSGVSLYHLERLSQSMVTTHHWKQELTYYNCWFHTQKWHADIVALKQAGSDSVSLPSLPKVVNG